MKTFVPVTRRAASQTSGKVIQLCTIRPHKNRQRPILGPLIWDEMNTKERVINQEMEAVKWHITWRYEPRWIGWWSRIMGWRMVEGLISPLRLCRGIKKSWWLVPIWCRIGSMLGKSWPMPSVARQLFYLTWNQNGAEFFRWYL